MGDRTTLPIEKAKVDYVLSDLSRLRHDALKAELEKRGLDTSGDKKELVDRFSEVLRRESLENEKLAETPEILGQIKKVLDEPDPNIAAGTIEDQIEQNEPKPSAAKSRFGFRRERRHDVEQHCDVFDHT